MMVSVCIATYNGAGFIKKQIDSIICQLDKDDEIIISDDGSTDDTLKIIESYNDSRIKILHHAHDADIQKLKHCKSYYYVTANFYNAIKNTAGDYIFLADQDDVWVKGRKEKMLSALQESDCVMCNYGIIDENDIVSISEYKERKPFYSSLLANLVIVPPFVGCCMAFTKKTKEYILPFPKKLICHDLWIGCLCAKKKQITWIQKPLQLYRRHSSNVSSSTEKSKNPLYFIIYYRIVFIFQFALRYFLGK